MTPEKVVEFAQELLAGWLAKRPDGIAFSRTFRNLEILSLARLRELCDPSRHDDFVKLIEDARRGNTAAKAEAYEWGALAVSCAENIPLPLRIYVVDKLLELAEAGRRRRGKNPNELLLRNFAIMYAVARVSEHGFLPTRNPTTDSRVRLFDCSRGAQTLGAQHGPQGA